MRWHYNDGGRKATGLGDSTGDDCVTRTIAIVTGQPFRVVRKALHELGLLYDKGELTIFKTRGYTAVDHGVGKAAYKHYLEDELRLIWTPTMFIGSGCKVHLRSGELPRGKLVVRLSKHLTAVIDGVIHDTFNPARKGTRCVYGYWHAA